jgi:hypothetical protein
MPTIENFPYQFDIATPDNCDPQYYPQYNQFLCKAILQATDYTQLQNSGILNVQQYADYREAIRQIMFAEPQDLITYLPPCPNTVR